MVVGNRPSTAALARLAFRLAVVLVFALAWPGEAPARAAGIRLALAAGCFGVAWTSGEKLSGPGLNRWHEGAFLIGLAVALFSWFGLVPPLNGLAESFSGNLDLCRISSGAVM